MAGRLCKICACDTLRNQADEAIAAGLSDHEAAKQLGLEGGRSGNQGRMVVWRHRKTCLEAPARAVVEAANRGRDVAERRKETIEAAQAGDPSAWLGLAPIVETLRGVSERLERVSGVAEAAGQGMTVSSLSGQQLKALELRGRLGGVGGFAGNKAAQGEGRPVFEINFNFRGAPSEQLTMTAETEPGPIIDVTPSASQPLAHFSREPLPSQAATTVEASDAGDDGEDEEI